MSDDVKVGKPSEPELTAPERPLEEALMERAETADDEERTPKEKRLTLNDRVNQALANQAGDAYKGWNKDRLTAEAEKRGLDATGTNDEIKARLTAHDVGGPVPATT